MFGVKRNYNDKRGPKGPTPWGRGAPCGGVAVEEHGQVRGELVEQAEEETAKGVADLPVRGAGQAEVVLESLGLISLADGLDQDAPGLGHAQGAEAVEHGEGLLPHDAVQGCPGPRGRAGGRVVIQRVPE